MFVIRRFFLAMSIVLLVIVLTGFAPTLYLRAFFDVPSIPAWVYVHGTILTGWFVLLCLQSSLAVTGRTAMHRRLGVAGAALGVAVIAANLAVLAGIGPRLRVALNSGEFDPSFVIRAVWGDLLSTVAFAVLLSAAIAFRRRPESHKRLMLLASVSIVGQALGRIGHWPLFDGLPGIFLPTCGLVFFLGSVVIYDVVTTRRVHPATLLGGAFRILVWLTTAGIGGSDFGQRVVQTLVS